MLMVIEIGVRPFLLTVILQTAGSPPPFFTYFSSSKAAKVQDKLAGGYVPWSAPGSHSLALLSFFLRGRSSW